jgi:hypothetical protein
VEISQFCELMTARLDGRKPAIRLSDMTMNGRLSPRWGIDFAAELRNDGIVREKP